MRKVAIDAGALGFGISGSGPTVFALSETKQKATAVAEAIKIEFTKRLLNADVFVSKVNQRGAYVIDNS
jgi:homoserine kinase